MALQQIGFDESSAVVLYWGTSKMDRTSLGRILRGSDALAEDVPPLSCIKIDLSRFVVSGLGLEFWSLGTVYQAYFYQSNQDTLSFHDALFDAEAQARILRRIRKDTQAL
ncbi:hypothetical protein OPT61_g8407 [Boeremia exigua]|uniref:Uncharacterized protein n=1 Tax=Boeremia exigua TaxID=749465 RepID=A0ACC2HZH8_9PLEO|nr:hypothetical protein OPT61_g8407 [Boeremia exigua]